MTFRPKHVFGRTQRWERCRRSVSAWAGMARRTDDAAWHDHCMARAEQWARSLSATDADTTRAALQRDARIAEGV